MFPDNINGMLAIKDLDGKYRWMSNICAQILGFNEYENKTDYDIPCDAARFADVFVEQDKLAMSGTITTIEILNYKTGFNVSIVEKNPTYHNGVLSGTSFHSVRINNIVLQKSLFALLTADNYFKKEKLFGSYTLGMNKNNSINLNDKEEFVLFHTIRGLSAKSISARMHLSPKTVEYYLAILKNKFGVNSKAGLIEITIALGYLNNIPKSCL